MRYYCEQCGRISQIFTGEKAVCRVCNRELCLVPEKYLIPGTNRCAMKPEQEQRFIEEVVKTSPIFEQERMDRRLEAQAINARIDAQERAREKWGIHCPYCNGTIIERISGMNRSVWFADAAAIGKQFQCLKCKAYF